MKHYRRFRIIADIINIVIFATFTAAFVYFVYEFLPALPIFD